MVKKSFTQFNRSGSITSVKKERATSFRFGDENSVKPGKTVTFPAEIGKKNILIKTDVIDSDLSLLLSESAMKIANA